MNNLKRLTYLIVFAALPFSCEQEVPEFTEGPCPSTDPTIICPRAPVPCEGTPGSANFGKFVAIGNSFVAGFQSGALFNEGQTNSLPAILNKQFACVGGSATFNQPGINSENGFNIFISPNPVPTGAGPLDFIALGRLRLQGSPPQPAPVQTPGDVASLPNPTANPGFIYTGSKTALNNFGVQATQIGQAMIPETGDWALAGVDPRFNPFYARFASDPGTSTMLSDFITSLSTGGTFFLFWLGYDDVLLHAVFGADPAVAPMTDVPTFTFLYNTAMTNILGASTETKGVIANFPEIFTLPHFNLVPYNAIPMDAGTATVVNNNFAGYNQILDALKGPPFNYAAAEVDARKISFAAGSGNPIVIVDEILNDYGDEFDALESGGAITADQRAALVPYEQVRQTTPTDKLPLAAGSVLGTLADPGNPLSVIGVAVPLADRYVLTPSEIQEINDRLAAFNSVVKATADANPTRIALADVNQAFKTFGPAKVLNNVTLTFNLNPPTGIFSEEGLHPNSRGYAYIATVFVDAINGKFGGTIPKPDVGLYKATSLPIP
jgi:hypothetical protein